MYDPGYMLGAEHTLLTNSDSTEVWVNFNKGTEDNKNPKIRNLYFHYRIVPDYSSNVILSSDTLSRDFTIGEDASGKIIRFKIKNQNRPRSVLVLVLSDMHGEISFIYDIELKEKAISQQYSLFDGEAAYPLFKNSVVPGEIFTVKNLYNRKKPLTVNYFNYDFAPALPPMANSNTLPAAKPFTLDSTFTINSMEAVHFDREGLYFIQPDTAVKDGISVIVEPNKFPFVTRTEDLTKPLIYVLTKNERTKLFASEKPKQELDAIWLQLAGNKPQAKRLIKAFYNRVEYVNRRFSTYKPGWKTDKGMIYIVYGKPDEVYKYNTSEIWKYDKKGSFSEINFSFDRRENMFSDQTYDLVRNERYNQIWYPMVEQWRNGVLNR